MANFDSPKAAGRNTSQPKTPALGGGKRSNQEQFTGTGAKAMGDPKPSSGRKFISETPREFSNQLQFSANPNGSNTLKDALNTYKQRVKPAAVNPGPDGRSQGSTRKAASSTAQHGPQNF